MYAWFRVRQPGPGVCAAASTSHHRFGKRLSARHRPKWIPTTARLRPVEDHISDSARIPSPFLRAAPLDRDLAFCARATGLLGPCIAQWRDAQVRALSQLAARLRPWELQLVKHMPPSVACVASQKRPAFMLMCAILLRWPDPLNALRFVTGYKLVGDIEHSGLFRAVEVDESRSIGLPALLGPAALNNLEALRTRVGPGQYDDQLRTVALGHAEGPFDQAQMDERFGLGGWRPLERFMLFQTDKYRPIDSGKKPGHNSASLERETIFTYLS